MNTTQDYDQIEDLLSPVESVEEFEERVVWDHKHLSALGGPRRRFKALMDAEGCLHWHELIDEVEG